MTGDPINSDRVELSGKVLKASLSKMERIFLQDTPYLSSDQLTIADLLGACELTQATLGLGMSADAYPKVTQWSHRVRDSVGAQLFDEAHQVIAKAGGKIAQMNLPTPKL